MDKQAIGDRCGHPLRIFGTVFAVVIVTLLVHTAPFEVGQRGAAPKALGARGGTEAGAHRDRLQPGELKCGVLWFLHIPKTGGATVQAYLKERTRRYADDDDRGVKGGPRPAGKAHARWLFVDIHNGELELAWAPKAYGTGDCEPGLSEGNMSGWSQSPAWRQALRELDKPEPRLVVHQESCSPAGFAELFRGCLRGLTCSLGGDAGIGTRTGNPTFNFGERAAASLSRTSNWAGLAG